MIYHSLFHAVMTYRIIFWGNSSHSTQVFRMQKKVIRIIMGCGSRESCRNLFQELNILPLMSQYIVSLLTFVSNNRDQYITNSETHNINTRHTAAIQQRLTSVLWSIPKEAFPDSFQKLYEHCQTCVVKDGDYFEGK
jgi:hypothetical protein